MKGILILAATALGGWIGWALGERLGLGVALFLSLVGTAAGLYFARRLMRYFGD